jgi:hypothetical protein
MEVYNRSAITVTPKKPFVDWNNKLTPEMYFKQIFEEELEAMWTDEEDWPQKRDFNTFCEWFDFEISDWVMDLSKKPLHSEW